MQLIGSDRGAGLLRLRGGWSFCRTWVKKSDILFIRSVINIDRNGLCIGCGICQSIAGDDHISLELREDGFYHPQVKKEDKKHFQIIKSVCPGIEVSLDNQINTKSEKIWGPYNQVYQGYACDEKIRWRASSGGGLSAVLVYLLEHKIVSKVIHTGASPTDPLRNITAISTSKKDIYSCAGSRYSPAAPLTNIAQIIHECDGQAAFVGRPCDVSAVKSYIKEFPGLKKKIFILISFFCAGTPSLRATDLLLQKMGAPQKGLKEFWYRGRGWPGKSTAIDKSGRQFSMLYQQSWGRILNTKLHFRCKICADGIGSLADLAFADGWEIKNGRPSFEERDGQNLIFSRTENGKKILQEAIENKYLKVKKLELGNLGLIQPSQYYKKKIVGARIFALRLTGLFFPKFKGFNIYSIAITCKPGALIRNLIGSLYRRFNQIKDTSIYAKF